MEEIVCCRSAPPSFPPSLLLSLPPSFPPSLLPFLPPFSLPPSLHSSLPPSLMHLLVPSSDVNMAVTHMFSAPQPGLMFWAVSLNA